MVVGNKLTKEDGDPFEDQTLYRSAIGALQCLTMTRPDIAITVSKLSQFMQQLTINHWLAYKRVMRYLKGT